MKKLFALVIAFLGFGLTVVSAQSSYYGETFEKETGVMRSRTWVSISKMKSRLEHISKDGKITGVTIFDMNTLTSCNLDLDKKTYQIMDMKTLIDGTALGVESLKVVDSTTERTVLGKEIIEGYDCTHYGVSTVTTTQGGGDSGQYDEWVWEPHGITIQITDEMRFGNYLVTKNINLGEPPANLLEIPEDFTEVKAPDLSELGAMLELFQSGKN